MQDLKQAMEAFGIKPASIVPDGKCHRCPGIGQERGTKGTNGWYVASNTDWLTIATFGDWKTGTKETWKDDGIARLDPQEQAEFRKKHEEQVALAEAKRRRDQAPAARKANQIWDASSPVPVGDASHPYLERKQVQGCGLRIDSHGNLVVPISGQDGKLISLQLIAPEKDPETGRDKNFLKGSKTEGGRFTIGTIEGAQIIGFCEGYATGASIHEATGWPVVVCFNAKNLVTVAKQMDQVLPKEIERVICGDDDRKTAKNNPKVGNPGRKAATEAARLTSAAVAFPDFSNREEEEALELSDFNDMHVVLGIEAVKTCILFYVQKHKDKAAMGIAYGFKLVLGGERPGVYHESKDDWTWVCNPLYVRALTRNPETHDNHGRLLEWTDFDGHTHVWAMPSELTCGDGLELAKELKRKGLKIASGPAIKKLLEYIDGCTPSKKVRSTEQVGWNGSAFVTPDAVYGITDDEGLHLQTGQSGNMGMAQSGTAHGWKNEVSTLAKGNTRLIFPISLALAAPLAHFIDETGGFHFRGSSSVGKSTALVTAASVWGDPEKYPQKWRATDNGLEAVCYARNDLLLILDELGQVDPKAAGNIAYMIANGQGKVRANRLGLARATSLWRTLFLSAGEIGLADHMRGSGGRTTAGQEIRMVDLEADAGKSFGLFDTLHGFEDGDKLSRHLRELTRLEHGTVGRAFLEIITRPEELEGLPDRLRKAVRLFDEYVPKGADGQVARVAGRFGLVAATGELATEYGLTGWGPGEARNACVELFHQWIEARGGAGSAEVKNALDQIRGFLEAHGESRFSNLGDGDSKTINRVGFKETFPNGETTFYVLPQMFKTEVCKGLDVKVCTKALIDKGWLNKPGKKGKVTQSKRLGELGPRQCYVVTMPTEENEMAETHALRGVVGVVDEKKKQLQPKAALDKDVADVVGVADEKTLLGEQSKGHPSSEEADDDYPLDF